VFFADAADRDMNITIDHDPSVNCIAMILVDQSDPLHPLNNIHRDQPVFSCDGFDNMWF
jgi:hypothetical protein